MRLSSRIVSSPNSGPTGRTLSQEDLEAFGLSVEVSSAEFHNTAGGPKPQQPGHFRLGLQQQQHQFSHPSQFSSTPNQPGRTPTTQFSPSQVGPGVQQQQQQQQQLGPPDTGQFRQTTGQPG